MNILLDLTTVGGQMEILELGQSLARCCDRTVAPSSSQLGQRRQALERVGPTAWRFGATDRQAIATRAGILAPAIEPKLGGSCQVVVNHNIVAERTYRP